MNNDLEAKIRHCIYAQALGDALGYAVEFDDTVSPLNPKLEDIRDVIDASGVARFSDDTQMAYSVAHGLLDAGVTASPNDRQVAVARRLLEWSDLPLGGSHRAPGGTCLRGVQRLRILESSDALDTALDRDHTVEEKGCGIVMRSAPIGWFYSADEAAALGAALAAHTHRGACAKAQGAVMAGMTAYALRSPRYDTDMFMLQPTLRKGVELARQYDRETQEMMVEAFARAAEYWSIIADASRDYEERARRLDHRVLSTFQGWRGDEALAAAAYCLLTTTETKACLLKAANTPGDSDSIAAVAGALAGIFWGVPDEWVEHIEEREHLEALVKKAGSAVDCVDIHGGK